MQYLSKIWDALEKYSTEENDESIDKFTFVIQQVAKIMFTKLSYKKKNYMFKFLLAFKFQDDEQNKKAFLNIKKIDNQQAQVKQNVIKKDTILKSPTNYEAAFDQSSHCSNILKQTKSAETQRIQINGRDLSEQYAVKYVQQSKSISKKAEVPQRRVQFDLQENKDQTIFFKTGYINTKNKEDKREEYIILSNAIIQKCREKKSVVRTIEWIINCFVGKYKLINYRQNFFFNFVDNINEIINPEMKFNKSIETYYFYHFIYQQYKFNYFIEWVYIGQERKNKCNQKIKTKSLIIFYLFSNKSNNNSLTIPELPRHKKSQIISQNLMKTNKLLFNIRGEDLKTLLTADNLVTKPKYDHQFKEQFNSLLKKKYILLVNNRALILFDELIMLLGEEFFNTLLNKTYSDVMSDEEEDSLEYF